MLTKNGYTTRLIDQQIESNLNIFGAISLEGPKWCGKTWTALNHANSVVYLNNPENGYQDRRYAMMDAGLVLDGESPRLLDEWQEVPTLWDAVRFRCDQDGALGKYLLTGSATPVVDEVHHSGAGRICRMNMYTMSLFETGDSSGVVSLGGLFDGKFNNQNVEGVALDKLAYFIIRGGWPGNIGRDVMDAAIVPKSYLNDVILHDISSIDGVERDQHKMEMLIRSLARNESSLAANRLLLKDISEDLVDDFRGENYTIGKNTLTSYLDVLHRLYITDNILAYSPNIRSADRVGKSVKRHFTDVSLASAALGLTVDTLVGNLNTFGLLFESLCLHDLRVYANNLGGKLYHFRNSTNGMEVDAIVELPNGDYGAIEIKLGTDSEESAVKGLLDFADSMEQKPKFLAVVNGLGRMSIQRPDGVYVFPITALRD